MALAVDTSIPFGNACNVSVGIEDGIPVVSFAADPHGGPESLWFCFRLMDFSPSKDRAGKVKLVLKHVRNMLGGNAPANIRPVVKPHDGDWERIGPGTSEKSPDGRESASWLIDAPDPFCDVAFCYPYGRADVDLLVEESNGCWKKDVIGVSQAARPLIRLSNGYGEEKSDRPGLYLTARQHSGETPGSWVLDGFLRHVATMGDKAPLIWAVPLTNIDGVEQGDYGKDNFPFDLNRAWGSPPMRHETLVFQRDMRRWKERCKPVLGIDFHAPGGCEKDGIYAYLPKPDKFPEEHKEAAEWADAAAGALGPEFAAEDFGRVAEYKSRWETPHFTTFCCTEGFTALAFETPYAEAGKTLLTREKYREAGKRMAEGVCAGFAEMK